MNDDLAVLEKKLEQFLAFCDGLRAENRALRLRIAGLEEERQSLVEKIDTTRDRLESLMERIPSGEQAS